MHILIFALLVVTTYPYCDGKPNIIPFYTEEPTLVAQVTNGKKFVVGDKNYNSTFTIVHLWGDNDKEMGVVYGTLLKDELNYFFEKIIKPYLYEKFVQSLPKELQEFIKSKGGIDAVLDLVYETAKDYTPEYFFDFMKGFSESSGVDFLLIRRFNMIPQFIKALPPSSACTLIGAYGKATTKGGLVQLRALDIGEQNTILFVFPVVSVMHYDDSNPIVNILAAGSVGCLSGFTKNGISISQKVWVTPESITDFVPGIVWNFDAYHQMRYSKNIEEMIRSMEDEKRTMSSYFGLGDNGETDFYMVKYEEKDLTVLDWNNQTSYDNHPKFEGIAYYDKGPQPSKNPCLGKILLDKYHEGRIEPEVIARNISPVHQTGDAQSIIYDWQDDKVFISYGLFEKKAYDGQYVVLNMSDFFKVERPSV